MAGVVRSLQAAGYTTATSVDDLSAFIGPATRSVVVTRTAWQQTPPALLRSLYERGVVIAALDVGVAELAPALAVATGGGMLPYLAAYPIFSVLYQCQGTSGVTSDLLTGWDIDGLIRSREANTVCCTAAITC